MRTDTCRRRPSRSDQMSCVAAAQPMTASPRRAAGSGVLPAHKKVAMPCSTAKFREETSKNVVRPKRHHASRHATSDTEVQQVFASQHGPTCLLLTATGLPTTVCCRRTSAWLLQVDLSRNHMQVSDTANGSQPAASSRLALSEITRSVKERSCSSAAVSTSHIGSSIMSNAPGCGLAIQGARNSWTIAKLSCDASVAL